jgi:Carboxypeptidase regulatory-like domain
MRSWILNCGTLRLALEIGVFLAQPVVGQAQDVMVVGTIYDASGNNGIRGATVQVVHESSGATARVVTDAEGNFQLPSLRPGVYKITAELKGLVPNDRRLEWLGGQKYIVNLQLYTPEQQARRPKPHLSALPANAFSPGRTPDGQPDLQGAWGIGRRLGGDSHSIEEGLDPTTAVLKQARGAGYDIRDHQGNVLVDPMRGKIPYQPWAEAKRLEHLANDYAPTKWEHLDAETRCLLMGPTRETMGGTRIRQLPGYVLFLSPGRATRIIPLDGRPHLPGSIKLWNGDSRGRWEGDTLVIETTNNNDKTWFDSHGSFHSDAMRVVERLTLVDTDTLYYEATIDDPTIFTQVWKMALTWDRDRNPEQEWEDACFEGSERTARNILEAGRRAAAAGLKGIHKHDEFNVESSYAPARLRDTDVPTPSWSEPDESSAPRKESSK